MMKQLRHDWWLVALILMLASCQFFGVQTPQTFNEKMAYGVITITGVRDEATKLVTLRIISPDDAQNVQNQADLSRAGLEIARTVNATDPAAGNARLDATLAGLNGLKAYLCLKPDAAGSPLCTKATP